MDRDYIFNLCREKYGTEPDYPFEEDNSSAVLRHSDSRKWYALVMNVSMRVFGLAEHKKIDVVNLKTDPIIRGSFINTKGIFPAYHMSKSCWISVLLDGTVSEETISFLIDISYTLTDKKYKRYKNQVPGNDRQIKF